MKSKQGGETSDCESRPRQEGSQKMKNGRHPEPPGCAVALQSRRDAAAALTRGGGEQSRLPNTVTGKKTMNGGWI